MEQELKPTSPIERKVQILNSAASKARDMDPIDRAASGYDTFFTIEEFKELVKIGTTEQEIETAASGIEFAIPDRV